MTTTPVTTTPAPAPGSIETSAFRSVGDASTPVGTSLQGTGPSSKAIADVIGSNYTYSVDLQTLKPGSATVDVGRGLFHYQDVGVGNSKSTSAFGNAIVLKAGA